MPQTLAEKQRETALAGRDLGLYEIHYRVPRGLNTPTLASHFTQIRKSSEDLYFEYAEDTVQKKFEAARLSDKRYGLQMYQLSTDEWLEELKNDPSWLDKSARDQLSKHLAGKNDKERVRLAE